MKYKNNKLTIEFDFTNTIIGEIGLLYSLIRKQDYVYLVNLFKFLVIYLGITGLLLAKGYFSQAEIDAFTTYYFSNRLASSSYQCFKQYLILEELAVAMETSKTIKLELVNATSDVKNLKNEIKLLQQSSENLRSLVLPDTTEVEIKLNERQAAKEADYKFRSRSFWGIVVGALVYEAVVLWIFW